MSLPGEPTPFGSLNHGETTTGYEEGVPGHVGINGMHQNRRKYGPLALWQQALIYADNKPVQSRVIGFAPVFSICEATIAIGNHHDAGLGFYPSSGILHLRMGKGAAKWCFYPKLSPNYGDFILFVLYCNGNMNIL
ncbi:hypothetical protein LJC63_04940 [Ruminococcaceae bacterium OttesenSCG-928-L11]|nr:hypothetical protein [Ruminococcaceae bacterium OttesenSCG-928-L11]